MVSKAVARSRWQERLREAARDGREMVVSPLDALELSQHLDRVGVVNLYLEAAIRQCGGHIHLDTETILRSTGERWRYGPDRGVGSGGRLTLGGH
jgi:hypothetical protein